MSGESFGSSSTAIPSSATIYSQAAAAGSPTTVTVGRSGRYVRIRHTVGGVPLSLAEVEVIGIFESQATGARISALNDSIQPEAYSSKDDVYIVSPNPAFDQVVVRINKENAPANLEDVKYAPKN